MKMPHELLAGCARTFPDKAAYYLGTQQRTWRQVHDRSDQFAVALQKLGVRKGDPVAILTKESFEVYEHFFACMKIGAIRVGINWRYTVPELMHIVRDSACKVLLVQADCADRIHELQAQLEAAGIKLVGYGGQHGLSLDYETLLSANSVHDLAPVPLTAEDTLFYSYTSGTTGNPKGVILSYGAVTAAIYQSIAGRGFSPDDILYLPAQSSWVAVVLNLVGVANGMSHVIIESAFDIVRFLRDIEALRVTVVQLGPTLLYRAIQEYKSGLYDLSSLRLLMYGSGPATPQMIRDAHATFGCDLLQSYGMTEAAGGWIAHLYPSDHRRALDGEPGLLKSCGRIVPAYEVSVRDDKGTEVAVGSPGEIWIRGATLMQGYLNLPEQTADTLRGDWLCTNDIGRVDDRGYLYLMDRKNFMIITGGVNVFPSSVETVLMEHAGIQEVAVVGVPHPEWGETVMAVIKPVSDAAPPDPASLARFCRQRLSKAECPKRFMFVHELPRSANGKVQKLEIRKWVCDQLAASSVVEEFK